MTELQQAIQKHAKLLDLSPAEAQADAEAIIQETMRSEKVSREFAEATFIEDIEDANPNEIKELEMKAKKNGTLKIGARLNAENKKGKRERKPNNDKRTLVQAIVQGIKTVTNSIETPENEEHKIDFSWNGVDYTVTLTAHRAPKAK